MKSEKWIEERRSLIEKLLLDLRDQVVRRELKSETDYRTERFIDCDGNLTDLTIAERASWIAAELSLLEEILN